MSKLLGALALAALLVSYGGCTTAEGARCNPQLFSDECTSGTQCTVPKYCAIAYCCPSVVTAQTTSTCQACEAPDGGTTD
jgi:hypothetical protein